jgi:sugar phosphate isomerase/epimerase
MQLFVSTTWMGTDRTELDDVLDAMDGIGADGIELGSTHLWRADLADGIKARWRGRIFTHNYFPPARADIVLNLGSANDDIRTASMACYKDCVRFAARIGAELYTIHPGYLAEPTAATLSSGRKNYDFVYSPARQNRQVAFERMIAELSELANEADRQGVRLAVETQGSVTQPNTSLVERMEDYDMLFQALGDRIALNFNVAHSIFAAKTHGFPLDAFVAKFRARFAAVELSHNDGAGDQHLPLIASSPALTWAARLTDLPIILEFRNATRADLDNSLGLARRAGSAGAALA